MSRIADPALAARITPEEVEWWAVTRPVTTRYGEEVAARDLAGRTVACFQHVLADTIPMLLPLAQAGARLRIAACNPDSTDDAAAAYLAANGAEVWAWSGMSEDEFQEGLDWVTTEPPDALSDMGGEAIAATIARGYRPGAALEATTTGLHRLATVDLPFPVLDWNGLPLKDRVHNRHHVGMEMWPVFSAITGLAVHGRTVLVVGFGPVGRGVALRARALGAVVLVAEVDPVRAVEATQHGCLVVPLAEGVARAGIVVTATGRDGVLTAGHLAGVRDGAFVCNVGHSNREIDVPWLDGHPHARVRTAIDRYRIDGRALYLLNRGNLVNLTPEVLPPTAELFDPFAAVVLRGLAWILDGGAGGLAPGLHAFPEHLEREIAAATLEARR